MWYIQLYSDDTERIIKQLKRSNYKNLPSHEHARLECYILWHLNLVAIINSWFAFPLSGDYHKYNLFNFWHNIVVHWTRNAVCCATEILWNFLKNKILNRKQKQVPLSSFYNLGKRIFCWSGSVSRSHHSSLGFPSKSIGLYTCLFFSMLCDCQGQPYYLRFSLVRKSRARCC